ncbi:uncharacterized protein B0P05DRAFT_635032 [Gilbertella persicaria]|uniref:uncharacterized protein n=1 Tax=Gilbertella persicaria TaxID=101096 RepID=UPI00221FD5B6|nr:uncharacterized protein B0P05DRAFT_635032 [Gilbertella persicaria]KAI8090283.1 hypothetical protein B0P05DRAFT_635032 [Gilbertella persicaria]
MLRRAPTSVSLTPMDVDIFKTIIKQQQHHQKVQEERDDIFMGRALFGDRKRTRLEARLEIPSSLEDNRGYL